jgi:hypothetical protein
MNHPSHSDTTLNENNLGRPAKRAGSPGVPTLLNVYFRGNLAVVIQAFGLVFLSEDAC